MALNRKRWIATVLRAILVLVLGVGTYELWSRTALRYHPWQLESHVDSLAADCRTGPGAFVFPQKLLALARTDHDAKHCLAHAEVAWASGRNYDPCVQKLFECRADRNADSDERGVLQDEKARLRIA